MTRPLKPLLAVILTAMSGGGCTRDLPNPSQESKTSESQTTLRAVLAVEPEKIDLGEVPILTERRFSAKVVNRGSRSVDLLLKSGCACTDVHVGASHLPAHMSTELTGLLRADASTGPFEKPIMVLTTDAKPLVAVVTLAGRFKRTIEFSPEVVTLHPDFLAGHGSSGRVTIRNLSSEMVTLTCGQHPTRGVHIELTTTTLKPGESCGFIVEADPSFLAPDECKFVFSSTHSVERSFVLGVRVRPVGALEVVPGALRFGVLSRKELLARRTLQVRIRGAALDRLQVEKVDAPPFLSVSSGPSNGRRSLEFAIEVVDDFRGADINGEIGITLAQANPKRLLRLSIPVTGLIVDAP